MTSVTEWCSAIYGYRLQPVATGDRETAYATDARALAASQADN
jgi:hypothetical protein